MSWFFTPQHKAQKNRGILKRIDETLSRQGLPSSVLHFLVFLLLEWQWRSVGPTPFGSYLFGLALVVMAAWRFIMIAQFEDWYGSGPARWRDWFIASGFLHAGIWSAYLVYRLSGPEHPIALLGLLYTLAVAAGGTFVYSLYGRTVKIYLAILLWPVAGYYGFTAESEGHWYISLAFIALYFYLVNTGGRVSELVWGFLTHNYELKMRLRTLEQAREANVIQATTNRRFIHQLLYRVKTPLSGLLGVLGMLSHDERSSEYQGMLNIAQRSGHSILDLVNDLEAFIEQRDHARVPESMVFNLRKTLEHALSDMGSKAHEHGLELAYLYHPDVPERIESDPQWLSNAFRRLLDFTLDSAEEGEITARIALDTRVPEERLLLSFYFLNSEVSVDDLNAAINRSMDTLPEDEDVSDQLTLMVAAAQFRSMGAELTASEDDGLKKIRVSVPMIASSQQASSFRPARFMTGRSVILVDMSPINERALTAEFLSWEMQVSSRSLEDLLREQPEEPIRSDFVLVNIPVEDAQAKAYLEQVQKLLTHLAQSDSKAKVYLYASQLQRGLFSELEGDWRFIEKPVTRDELLQALRDTLSETRLTGSEESQYSGARLLLAEDNLVNQKVVVKLLQRIGIRVDTCVNGQEAAKMATADSPYDLVIMDCLMPRMDGLAATRAIRQHELDSGEHVPIIAMTAEDTPEQERACLAAGMDDFIAKPVTYEHLVTLIQRWVG